MRRLEGEPLACERLPHLADACAFLPLLEGRPLVRDREPDMRAQSRLKPLPGRLRVALELTGQVRHGGRIASRRVAEFVLAGANYDERLQGAARQSLLVTMRGRGPSWWRVSRAPTLRRSAPEPDSWSIPRTAVAEQHQGGR